MKSAPEVLSLPVVIMTTSNAETDIAKAYAGHANSYVVKPIDFALFTRLIQELGLYWLAWNEPPV